MSATLPGELAGLLERAGPRLGPLTNVSWHPEVGSTNDVALAQAEAGAPEGTVIIADTQVRGRGRLGRQWVSPPGAGIYMSVVLRPPVLSPMLTLAAGVAVAEGIDAATGLRPTVKWPNDLCVLRPTGAPRKVGGILAEGSMAAGPFPCTVVVGIGINIQPAAYPPDVTALATSLEDELGRPVDRSLVIVESLAALWRRYGDVCEGRTSAIVAAWRTSATATFGRRIEWQDESGTAMGVITGIDDAGALMVRGAGGVIRLVSGEVRWIS